MNTLRTFFTGGWMAYRALFNFYHPAVYVPTMLCAPIAQLIFFTYLGRYTGAGDDAFFVTGNAVQASVMAGIFATVMLVANERQFQTLGALLVTPMSRLAVFGGRVVPPALNGVLVSIVALTAGSLLFGLHIPVASLPGIAVAVVLAATSCAMLGLVVGVIAARFNDLWFGSNLVFTLTLLLCGVNVPLDALPSWLATAAEALPLTHGLEATRGLVAGQTLADVAGMLVAEAVVGTGYGALGFGLLALFEAESRRRATLV